MAKGKKGPALFEVIRAAQQKQAEQQRKAELARLQPPRALGSAASRLMSPGYWFGSSGSSPAAETRNTLPVHREISSDAISPPVASDQSDAAIESDDFDLSRSIQARVSQPESSLPTPAQAVLQPVARPVVTPVTPDANEFTPAEDIARRVREEIASASRVKETYDDAGPDPVFNNVSDLFGTQHNQDATARRTFSLPFQLNYATGLIAGMVVLLLVGATLIVMEIQDGSSTRLADAAPRPDVLDVKPPAQLIQSERPADNTAVARAGLPATESTALLNTAPQSIKSPANLKRVVGYQYVVLLSFPREDDAKDLVKFLTDNGVPATAEQALPGYSKSWFSVVTTRGFERTRNNADFDQFIARLGKLMEKYAKGSKFKTFKPDVYTWRAPS